MSGGAGLGSAPGTGGRGGAPPPNTFGPATTNGSAPGSNMLSPGANEFGSGGLPGGSANLNSSSELGTGSSTTGSGSSVAPSDTLTPGTPTTNFGAGGMQPLPGSPADVPGNLGTGLSTPGSR